MSEKQQGPDERRVASWISGSVVINGDVVSSGDLVIDGQVQGTIEVGDHSLTIGTQAAVTANLTAKLVTISGKVTGNVTGLTKVELKASAVVEGDINAPNLVMEDGASLRGMVSAQGSRR